MSYKGKNSASSPGWSEINSRVRRERMRESIRNNRRKTIGKNQLAHGVVKVTIYAGMFALVIIIGNGLAAV